MSDLLRGKAAIVTGASSGIGRAIAHLLGEGGMNLWLVGRSMKELRATESIIRDSGGRAACHCISLELTQPANLSALVTEVADQEAHLFALINNAGLMHPERLLDIEADRLEAMFNVNLFTPIAACRAAVKAMRARGCAGHLINISSLAAREDRYGGYGITKSAVNHLGRTLRHELEADDIRVTTIEPGAFATNLARGLTPEALARLEASIAETGINMQGDEGRKVVGDPIQIAKAVKFVLEQPIEFNLEHITVRPAIGIDM